VVLLGQIREVSALKLVPIPTFCFLAMFALVATPLVSASSLAVYGTGVGPGGPLADGSVDSYYTLTSSDPSTTGPSAYVTNQNQLGAKWLPDTSASKWITPNANGKTSFGRFTYNYTTTFDLTGFNLTTVDLSGELAADDKVALLLNGSKVLGPVGHWNRDTAFSLTTGFVAGVNTLEFEVSNSGKGPTGLDVALSGTASLISAVPEPASSGLVGAALMGLMLGGFGLAKRFRSV
jgi:hypothetical protein